MIKLCGADPPPNIIQNCVQYNQATHDKSERLAAVGFILLILIPFAEVGEYELELNKDAKPKHADRTDSSEPRLDTQDTFLAACIFMLLNWDLPLVLPQPESVEEAHYQSRQSDCHDGKEHVAVVENEGGEGVADQCTQVQVEQV